MRRILLGAVLLAWFATPSTSAAQGGDGSLRGVVTDQQGAAVPGVTITATSPALIAPALERRSV